MNGDPAPADGELAPWEKPRISDFRGTNRSRPAPAHRGLEASAGTPVGGPHPPATGGRAGTEKGGTLQPAAKQEKQGEERTANASTKQAIRKAGGGTLALAIAMLEDKHLSAWPHSDYPFGDRYPDGKPKTGEAANFGVFKMNWFMIRQCPSTEALIGNRPASVVWSSVGMRINTDVGLATRILLDAVRQWSIAPPSPAKPIAGNFWAGHRWGESGLNALEGTDWRDITRYYRSVQAIKARCDRDEQVWNTDVRYWVEVPPV